MSWESDGEFSDEEKQLSELRELEVAALEDNETPDTNLTPNLSKLTPRDQKRYENIRAAYSLNKLLSDKLSKFEKQLIVRLKECRDKLSALHAESNAKIPEKLRSFRYVTCGKPYFKDRESCPPPDNEDTITMKNAEMFDFCDIHSVTGWTLKDKSMFMDQILTISRKIRKRELISQCAVLKRKVKVQDCKEIQKEIAELQKRIAEVETLPLEEVVKPIDEEYDWEVIADLLNHRHSPGEYKSIWKLFLHPSINKGGWSRSEHAKLQEIVHAYRLQDWDEIAKELSTGRTGYQCFVYFRTHMSNSLIATKWTKEEEEYLTRLVEYYKEDNYIPWGKVAASMENRTKIQIYNKYSKLTELRKGKFLPEEDAVLLTCVNNFGKDWRKIANYIPGRSGNQVRKRYYVVSNAEATKASVVWTSDEDKKLIQLMAHQDSLLVDFASISKHFPGKDRTQLRARYMTLSRWMKRHPNKDISMAPRRGARRLCHGKGVKDLEIAVENLKKRIQSEVESIKTTKLNKNSPEDAIEHAIVATLITENVREEALKKQSSENQTKNSDSEDAASINEKNLKSLLILLKARLKKDLFKSSMYCMQYPHLLQEEVQKSVMKVRSYSKKAATTMISVNRVSAPINIWGNSLLMTDSVIPPNYSTITGCRRLMALATNMVPSCENRVNVSQIMRKNPVVKEHIELFMERFNTLFLWPMLLSNENPRENGFYYAPQKNIRSRMKDFPNMFYMPSVVLPQNTESSIVNDIIDLNDDDDADDLVVKTHFGSDVFKFMSFSSEDDQ